MPMQMSLVQQIWDTLKPKFTPPTPADEVRAKRPVLAPVEDINDIIDKIRETDASLRGNKPQRERSR